jgi:hypothetical protein
VNQLGSPEVLSDMASDNEDVTEFKDESDKNAELVRDKLSRKNVVNVVRS